MSLNPADLDKFARICGMLGSNHDGERAAAALKATEFLRARNLTWEDFVRQRPAEQPRSQRRPHWSEGPRTDAEWLRALKAECWELLSDWERKCPAPRRGFPTDFPMVGCLLGKLMKLL
jgi:hypothetical protein